MRRGITALAAVTVAGLGLAGPAFAADTLVATGDATSVGQTTADLNGAVYREQVGARWLFEYSTNSSFNGSVLSTGAVPTTSRVTAVERQVSGLAPKTLYYWRLVVVYRVGTHTVQSFGATAALQTLAASDVSSTQSAARR